MHRLRQASLFDLHPVDISLLKPNVESKRNGLAASPPASITAVARGCHCLWLGDSLGRLHRVTLNYRLTAETELPSTFTGPAVPRVTHPPQSGIDTVSQEENDDEGGDASPTVQGMLSDPILTVTEASAFPLFNSSIIFIFVSSSNHEELQTSRQLSTGYESLVLIGSDSPQQDGWRCKVFLLNQTGKFVSRSVGAGSSKIPRLAGSSSPAPPSGVPNIPKPIKSISITTDSNREDAAETAEVALFVTAACLNTTGRILAVALSNGGLIWYQSDFRRHDDPIRARNLKWDPIALQESTRLNTGRQDPLSPTCRPSAPSDVITNLCFCDCHSLKAEVLFVTTLRHVTSYTLPTTPNGFLSVLYSDTMGGGCSQRCASLDPFHESLVVLREGGLFFYHAEQGNLSALPTSGSLGHALCTAYRSYYAITVTQDPGLEKSDSSWILQGSFSSPMPAVTPLIAPVRQTLNIALNLPPLRLLAFSFRFIGVSHVQQFGSNSLLVFTKLPDGFGAVEIREKTAVEKVEVLLKKRLFEWAVAIAKQDELPEQFLEEIRTLHAEWLFDKGKYLESVEVFCTTIGSVESSHVISKFLSRHRLDCLIIYIKHLYTAGLATPAHLAILFKCFALRQDLTSFEAFLDQVPTTDDAVDWTVAIDECRAAGHYQLAKKIAQKQNCPSLLLSILIDDLDDPEAALTYLESSVSHDVSIPLILQSNIGAPLLRKQPDRMFELIKRFTKTRQIDLGLFIPLFFHVDLIPDQRVESQASSLDAREAEDGPSGKPWSPHVEQTRFALDGTTRNPSLRVHADFENHLLRLLTETLGHASCNMDAGPPPTLQVAVTALELLFRRKRQLRRRLKERVEDEEEMGSIVEASETTGLKEQLLDIDRDVEAILRHHVKSNDRLLSAFCLARLYEDDKALTVICERIASLHGSALKPLALMKHPHRHTQESRTGIQESRTETHVSQYVPLAEVDRALWSVGAMQAPFLRFLETGDASGLLSYCMRSSGAMDQPMYLQALAAFASVSDPHQDKNALIRSLLNHLLMMHAADNESTLHPLTLIRLLGRFTTTTTSQDEKQDQRHQHRSVTLGAVKGYLLQRLSCIRSSYDQHKSQFIADCKDIQQTRLQIKRLRHELQTFSLVGVLCKKCEIPVELPSVQFLCGHAYHRYCLLTHGAGESPDRRCTQCTLDIDSKKQLLSDRVALLLGLTPSDFCRDFTYQENSGPVPVVAQSLMGRGVLLRELPEML